MLPNRKIKCASSQDQCRLASDSRYTDIQTDSLTSRPMHKVERSKPTSAQRNHDMTSCDWLSLVASFSIVAIATIRGRCTLSQGDLNHHLIYGSLGPLESSNQTASRAIQLFLHSSQQSVSVLYNGPSSPQNCPLPWGSGPPRSIT